MIAVLFVEQHDLAAVPVDEPVVLLAQGWRGGCGGAGTPCA